MTSPVIHEDMLPTGCHWSLVMRKGCQLRLTDVAGGANLGMLLYNPSMPLERLNLPDTLKCQHTFKLTRGHCLYSDMGRIFCSVTEDSAGWHDAVGGTCNRSLVEKKWGVRTFQAYRNGYLRNGRDGFLIELAKYGLGKKDLAANVNFFSKVVVDDNGRLHYEPFSSHAGDTVTLRFEMDTLVIMHACPHPMNTLATYPQSPVNVAIAEAPAVSVDDLCLNSRPENGRGFLNNALFHMASPGVARCGGHSHDH